jgi:isopentenyl-diphosphate delta-isomerase
MEETLEQVVLLDEDGRATGSAPKRTVHHERTPLHLAFSCYVFDDAGDEPQVLLSRRALHKPTWPGVWTNSFCGHPAPGEDFVEAVRRRAQQELGIALADLQLTLAAFRYEATMNNGVRENELCPVFTARTHAPVRPDAAEVAEVAWVPWRSLREEVLTGERDVSPWCVDQVAQLAARETAPARFAPADAAELPAAARVPA